MKLRDRIQTRTRQIKQELLVVALALRDPRTPWYAKLVAGLTIAYAVSPIDLVPDFLPVIGYLDDLLVLPMGFALTKRLIPPHVLAECRTQVTTNSYTIATSYKRIGIISVIIAWILALVLAFCLISRVL